MSVLDQLCRKYQSLFTCDHPEEARLVQLHSTGQQDQFLREYFDHEFAKGEKTLQRFQQLAPGWTGARGLDFGCGAGGLTYRLGQFCREAVGIDLDPEKIEFGNQQASRLGITNVRMQAYPGDRLPFEDQSFDTVLCVDVVEHLPRPEFFLKEFERILAPGGYLLLSFGPPWYHAHGKHMWAKLPGWWTHLLFPRPVVMRVSGFDPKTTWEELGLHRLSVGRFRQALRQTGLQTHYHHEHIQRRLTPLRHVPLLRELLIGEVIGIYRKPGP
ncbi:MAG: class I SAM-dependent methyltransferase [Gemmataceae bacterium]